jgi:hypothetical protein
LFKCEGGFYSAPPNLAVKDLLAIGLMILLNLYPTEVILRLLHGIQFQMKNLIFGLKRNDKKTKNFEMLVKTSVKMLESDFFWKVEEREIEKLTKKKKN